LGCVCVYLPLLICFAYTHTQCILFGLNVQFFTLSRGGNYPSTAQRCLSCALSLPPFSLCESQVTADSLSLSEPPRRRLFWAFTAAFVRRRSTTSGAVKPCKSHLTKDRARVAQLDYGRRSAVGFPSRLGSPCTAKELGKLSRLIVQECGWTELLFRSDSQRESESFLFIRSPVRIVFRFPSRIQFQFELFRLSCFAIVPF
jgi:hypothetical protein